jgi:cell wall assembly regulator SMI1
VPLDEHLLSELEARWRAQTAPIAERLTPGLSNEEINAITGPLGVRLPAEARLWWQWHNGVPRSAVTLRAQRTIGGAYYEYLPLEEAATGYRQLREIAAEVVSSPEQHADDFWHPSWWPISSNAGGAWIACQCDVAEDKPTPIRAISFVESTQFEPPVLASFGELIQHFINGLDQGVWRYDGDTGRWVKDFDRHTAEQQAVRIL